MVVVVVVGFSSNTYLMTLECTCYILDLPGRTGNEGTRDADILFVAEYNTAHNSPQYATGKISQIRI